MPKASSRSLTAATWGMRGLARTTLGVDVSHRRGDLRRATRRDVSEVEADIREQQRTE